jgi:hypothetical protein
VLLHASIFAQQSDTSLRLTTNLWLLLSLPLGCRPGRPPHRGRSGRLLRVLDFC